MESITVPCECGARVKMPATVAGKKVRCPKCGGVIAVPRLSAEAPTLPLVAAAKPVVTQAAATKECQFCGESILATAKKCKHCGEYFEEAEPALGGVAMPSRRGVAVSPAAKAASETDPNPAEYFAGIAVAPVGLLIGAVWAAKKLPKAKKMLQVSGAMCLIYAVAGFLVWNYYLRGEDDSNMAKVPDHIIARGPVYDLRGGEFSGPEDQGPPQQPRQRPGGLPGSGGGGEVNLDGQPPQIQKAMKANVRIELDNALGSGVVLQREGEEVLILTNHHVVDMAFALSHGARSTPLEKLPQLKVTYYTQQSNPGKVLWVAPDGIDLAIVKAPAPAVVEPVTWQAIPKLSSSQDVFAVGNPFGLGWTYTKGVLSATRKQKFPAEQPTRDVPIIQTDTTINPGNSGGGLYASDGELIGINSSIVNPEMGNRVGFAIGMTVLLDLKPEGLALPSSGGSK